uniref:Uncharacterized protein n=1 Tax=Stegastes partitus TaxID=144197 RepID=A0A3B4ZQM7_9TELE
MQYSSLRQNAQNKHPRVVLFCWLLKEPPALQEPEICYVLDGILFLYGVILTALYCRIKLIMVTMMFSFPLSLSSLQGLTPHAQDTYETIGMKK